MTEELSRTRDKWYVLCCFWDVTDYCTISI